ncbi:hypothetical protein [Saccharopolyspora gregorii]|uniref:hypothetical protein n=1 Tax=Saccharopolyspora gregorii TaxID=33914 RepID=UPI0021AD38C3|nr:hypothetical protein [Saccharopolyspora gregorii]
MNAHGDQALRIGLFGLRAVVLGGLRLGGLEIGRAGGVSAGEAAGVWRKWSLSCGIATVLHVFPALSQLEQ